MAGGTVVGGSLETTSPLDTYPTHDSNTGRGGLHHVQIYEDLDGITAERRQHGMLVHVAENDEYYRLLNDLSTWQKFINANSSSFSHDITVTEGGEYVASPDDNTIFLEAGATVTILSASILKGKEYTVIFMGINGTVYFNNCLLFGVNSPNGVAQYNNNSPYETLIIKSNGQGYINKMANFQQINETGLARFAGDLTTAITSEQKKAGNIFTIPTDAVIGNIFTTASFSNNERVALRGDTVRWTGDDATGSLVLIERAQPKQIEVKPAVDGNSTFGLHEAYGDFEYFSSTVNLNSSAKAVIFEIGEPVVKNQKVFLHVEDDTNGCTVKGLYNGERGQVKIINVHGDDVGESGFDFKKGESCTLTSIDEMTWLVA